MWFKAPLCRVMRVITRHEVRRVLERTQGNLLNVVSDAYQKHHTRVAINPPSYFMTFPDKPGSRIIALPACSTDSPRIAGIKWIASNPENINKGLERASAAILLNDYETGYPVACIEGAEISAYRTVYSAVLAAKTLLQGAKVDCLGLIGCGHISRHFVAALQREAIDVKSWAVHDRKREACNWVGGARFFDNPDELVKNCDVIFCSTTTAVPYLLKPEVFSRNPLVLNISLRDLAPEILLASNNIVDDVDHVLNANTSPHLAYQKSGCKNFINGTLAEAMDSKVKLLGGKPTIFSPMGLGVLDLFLAHHVYKNSAGIKIHNFFG